MKKKRMKKKRKKKKRKKKRMKMTKKAIAMSRRLQILLMQVRTTMTEKTTKKVTCQTGLLRPQRLYWYLDKVT